MAPSIDCKSGWASLMRGLSGEVTSAVIWVKAWRIWQRAALQMELRSSNGALVIGCHMRGVYAPNPARLLIYVRGGRHDSEILLAVDRARVRGCKFPIELDQGRASRAQVYW